MRLKHKRTAFLLFISICAVLAVIYFSLFKERKIIKERETGAKDSTTTPLILPVELISSDFLQQGFAGSAPFFLNVYDDSGGHLPGLNNFLKADTIPYTAYKEYKIFQGDIILDEVIHPDSTRQILDSVQANKDVVFLNEILERVEYQRPLSRRQKHRVFAVSQKAINRRWPHGEIFYSIHPNIRNRTSAIQDAIGLWQSKVPEVHFKLFDPIMERKENYVQFVPGGYGSYVGMKGGKQVIEIESNPQTGKIAHEIGHLLGLWHEHSHPGRERYIQILIQNIDNRAEILVQFQKLNSAEVDTTAYDFGSIMHYPPDAFSINNQPTIRLLPQYSGKVIGQRVEPSDEDVKQVRKIYKNQ
jgi:hypothetical protein